MTDRTPSPKGDPYESDPPYTFECANCVTRIESDHRRGVCPSCGGELENISKPRGR